MSDPILVTGAGGAVGGVGHSVVERLRSAGLPVRAFVHRDDERADELRVLGAEVVVGDLLYPGDVAAALKGCRRALFSLSVSPEYLEAATTFASLAGELEVLVDLSQMTVSQMTPVSEAESHQQRLHFLSERVFDWAGVPVVHVRPTVFLDNPLFTTLAARTIASDGELRLPFGRGSTSPVAAADVAAVVTAVLERPEGHRGHVLELTGPRVLTMEQVADAYTRALGRPVRYVDVPADAWESTALAGFSPHLRDHLATLARLHREGRFDRHTDTVEAVLGRPAQTVEAFVAEHAAVLGA